MSAHSLWGDWDCSGNVLSRGLMSSVEAWEASSFSPPSWGPAVCSAPQAHAPWLQWWGRMPCTPVLRAACLTPFPSLHTHLHTEASTFTPSGSALRLWPSEPCSPGQPVPGRPSLIVLSLLLCHILQLCTAPKLVLSGLGWPALCRDSPLLPGSCTVPEPISRQHQFIVPPRSQTVPSCCALDTAVFSYAVPVFATLSPPPAHGCTHTCTFTHVRTFACTTPTYHREVPPELPRASPRPDVLGGLAVVDPS